MIKGSTSLFPPIQIEIIDDPEEIAESEREHQQFRRNWDWLKQHSSEIYPKYRGKYICVAGQEVFAAEDSEDAWAMAESAHPDDEGAFSLYLPVKRALHVHANQR